MENRLVFEKKELKKYDRKVLGISGENEQEMLIFLFEDGFVDGICYLELEFKSGRKYSIETEKDEINECYKLEVKNSLLKKDGLIGMQLKIVNGTAVWKSVEFEMHVLEAINAVESMEEEYPSFVELTKIRMQEIETGFSQLDEKVEVLEGKEETDPTVPAYVKEITQENIDDWNCDEVVVGAEPTANCKLFVDLSEDEEEYVTKEELQQALGNIEELLMEV